MDTRIRLCARLDRELPCTAAPLTALAFSIRSFESVSTTKRTQQRTCVAALTRTGSFDGISFEFRYEAPLRGNRVSSSLNYGMHARMNQRARRLPASNDSVRDRFASRLDCASHRDTD